MSFTSTGTELLFVDESTASEDLKLTRLVRHYRSLAMTNPRAHVSLEGYFGRDTLQLVPSEFMKERYAVEAWLLEEWGKLVARGIPEPSLRVYVPFQVKSDAARRSLKLAAHDSAPGPAFPRHGVDMPPIVAFDPSVSASVVLDPRAKPEEGSNRAGRVVESQLEVSIWDDRGNRKIAVVPRSKVTLSVGPNGVEEVGGELTAFKLKLKSLDLAAKTKWGVISKVEIAIKVEGSINLDHGTADRMFREWKGKLKAALSFELNVPRTLLKLPIEIASYVDTSGQPGVALQFTLFEFD